MTLPIPYSDLLAQATGLHSAGQLSEAEAVYNILLSHNPEHVEALNLLATLNAQQGRLEEGLQWLTKAAAIEPNYPETYYNQGLILQNLGRHAEAVASYSKAINLRPSYTEAYVNHGVTLNKMERYEEAVESYDQAIALNPEQAISYYNRGLSLQALKRHEEAVGSFDKAIARRPTHAMAYSNRGSSLYELKRYEEALHSFDNAILLKPEHATTHFNRGLTLQALKRMQEALASYDQAIALEPGYADGYSNRGVVLNELKHHDEALASYNKAIALQPGRAGFYYNKGNALKDLKRFEDALACYNKAIELDPYFADYYSNRGVTLNKMHKHDDALESYDKAIALKADFGEAHNNRGATLQDLQRYDDALASQNKAITLKYATAESYNNRGITLKELGQFDEALASHDKAIELDPDYAEAYSNRGVLLQEMQRYKEAIENFDMAIAIRGYENAYWNKAVCLLLLGRFEEGWKLYEWRWKTVIKIDDDARWESLWTGKEPLQGKTILIHAEQGLGDTIQLCRYVPLVAALGANIILRVQPPLKGILSTLAVNFQLTTQQEPIAASHFHIPFFSLPMAFGTTVDTVPQNIPYLFADPEKVKKWQERLGEKKIPRIGLVWSGATGHVNDKKRSIPLEMFAPLLASDFDFHSLQREYREADAEYLAQSKIVDHAAELTDFTETAALISEMDMVISVDTSVAHLAGALGKKLWILITYTPDYRWMMNRDDTPWYPAARLFRQEKYADWAGVIKKVIQELKIDETPAPLPDALAKAMEVHSKGDLSAAEALYKKAITAQPDNADALSLLGAVCAQLGKWEEGLQFLDRAVALNPALADAYGNRGVVLNKLKRAPEALANYDKSLALQPGNAGIHYNRGNILKDMGRHEEAVAGFDNAIRLEPDYAEAYNNRALALQALKQHESALQSLDKAIALKTDYAEAYNNRALSLQALAKYRDALEDSNKAVALKPNFAEAYNTRGTILQETDAFSEALTSFDKAIELQPGYADAYNNSGFVLQKMNRFDEAMQRFEKAIALNPDNADAHWNKAVLKLLLGEFKEGWELYEWRWKSVNKTTLRPFDTPLWLGKEPIKGKTLLLHAEQGVGDTIQLCRYIPLVEAKGAKVIVEAPASLAGLLSTMKGKFQVVVQGNALPAFDMHCPFFSLPLAFGTLPETIPAEIPYLYAKPEKSKEWEKKLGRKNKPHIGLAWSGDPKHGNDRRRSIPFDLLEPLLREPYAFHSLQKEVKQDDRVAFQKSGVFSYAGDLKDFEDTAALIAEMDLVISVDTSVAHLAGALGKNVWILLPFSPDYRWLAEGNTTRWYPTAHLFRQEKTGDWQGVIAQVKSKLQKL